MSDRSGVFPVLVVSGGGFQGLGIARGLAAIPGVRILVADSLPSPVSGLLADDVARVPPIRERDLFLESLDGLIDRTGVRLLIPATEYELALLADERPRLERERGVRVAVSAPAVFEEFGDRLLLARALEQAGIPRPPIVDLTTATSADLPLLGKPRRSGWGGRGHLTIDTPEELERRRTGVMDSGYVWTHRLEDFTEISVDFSIDFEGSVSTLVGRERLRTSAGFCVVARGSESDDALGPARRVADLLARAGGRGLFNVQVLLTPGRSQVSDLNLRFGTSGVFPLGLGVNPIAHLVRSAKGEKATASQPASRGALRMYRPLVERYLPGERANVSALLFDLDDTLLDHKGWILAKLELLWESMPDGLGDRESFLEAGWEAMERGQQAVLLDVIVSERGLSPELRGPLIERYRELFPKRYLPHPDVLGALTAMRQAGLRLGLVTDSPPPSQRQKLVATGLAPLFDTVVFSRETGGEKPAPEPVLSACGNLGVDPAAVALVGDDPLRDGRAALRAGLALFYWIRRPGAFVNVSESVMARLAPSLRSLTVEVEDLRFVAESLRTP